MRDHSLILTRLVNTPLYLDIEKAIIITENISLRLAMGQALDSGSYTPQQREIPNNSNSIAVIKVFDSLVAKGGAGESGFTSYESIQNRIKSALDNGFKKIGFYIASPGGEAMGMEGLVNYIHSLSANGISTFSFTDQLMASAAYGISSATQRRYAMPTSKSGSIGTILTLMDMTERDKQDGISYMIMRSKDEKALYNPHEKISKEVIAKAREEMMLLDASFNNLVNKTNPNLSIDKIISLKGNAFYGEEALSLGLVDQLVSGFDEVLAIESASMQKKKPFYTGKKTMNEEELIRANAELQAKLAQLEAANSINTANALAKERERVAGINKAGETFKIPKERVNLAIEKGASYEDTLAAFELFAEISGSKNAIDTSVNNPSNITPKPETNKDSPFAFLSAMDEAINLGLLG